MNETTNDEQVNAALARVMGWSGLDEHWRTRPPNYISDPAASCELEDWLASRGWSIDTHQHAGWTAANLTSPEGHPDPCDMVESVNAVGSAARRRALAMAAHKALCGGEK